MRIIKWGGIGILAILCAAVIYFVGAYLNYWSKDLPAGVPVPMATPAQIVEQRDTAQSDSARSMNAPSDKHILFGDLHVHTTFSFDAFLWSLPILGGQGPHSVADACDFARFCSALDFWSITDHAEASTQRRWQETVESMRQCSALGEPKDGPASTVSYLGFEWTQVGQEPQDHYGHKNVIFRHLGDEDIVPRPIASGGVAQRVLRNGPAPTFLQFLLDVPNRERYFDFRHYVMQTQAEPACSADSTADEACYSIAERPDQLFKMLDDVKGETLVIPHGTSWGFYTPPTSSWDKQLTPAMRPERQELIEVMSGHGNSEEYRPYESVLTDADGNLSCAPETEDFTPMCRMVGKIIHKRCLSNDNSDAVCTERADQAIAGYLRMGMTGHRGLKGEHFTDYLDADQCKDCFLPAFSHRPKGSIQYALAVANFDDSKKTRRFRFGFISSSDNHRSRPGTGYKQIERRTHTEASGAVTESAHRAIYPDQHAETPDDIFEYTDPTTLPSDFSLAETERQASFWTPGGLAAVHAESRDRNSIWDAMRRRETYGTSGPRMLLWFDLIDRKGTAHPMGSQLNYGTTPKFRVRAMGAYVQKPGCPEYALEALGVDRLKELCANECYNPSDVRVPITHIDIVRIRPQKYEGEQLPQLIEDPWKRIKCPADGSGCEVTFTDAEYAQYGRDTVYYARAVQTPTPTVNADNLRCNYDEDGNCIEVNPCYGERYLVGDEDNCLADASHRAWSSPIFLDFNHAKQGAALIKVNLNAR